MRRAEFGSWFRHGDRSSGEMWVIAVFPTHIRRGIGGALLKKVETWLFSEGCSSLWLTTDVDTRLRAYSFYKEHGWHDWKIENGLRYMRKRLTNRWSQPLASAIGEGVTPMQFSSHPSMAQVARLLAQCGLPSDDILLEQLPNFILARDGESEVGVAGLQVLGSNGLVRSVAVLPTHRSRGLGTKLLAAVEERARGQGVRQLFLLTHDAQLFFLAHGYTESSRVSAPAEIQRCSQFGSSCCGAATLMCKPTKVAEAE